MSDSAIFFKSWMTDYSDDDLQVLRVAYLTGELHATTRLDDGRYAHYALQGEATSEFKLAIKLFSYTKSRVFEVLFYDVTAYRVLDEHGLCDLWPLDRPNRAMFKVGGHGWTKESPISFAFGGDESWMIATDWDCVEIISTSQPIVRDLAPVEREIVDEPLEAKDPGQAVAAFFERATLTKRLS
ncbi:MULTISPECIES: hypothetical protein [unclassified Sphingopyxis]|uniref:hypothetical protein n=1 Tax=unclassified Sphingopyxis TaxID=2614943 RepID=UPI0007318957|nr:MULTISPECIES: hypothetical protein [unclassified Sphingopyxis]KTE24362.1 hypothetical protein ATE61_13185 [Sphingopyxis sp. H057]KTE50889.1 hypothetical protein ATE69_16880 [Sphingopyxis sp. H071]KTE52033.1 hypothetical protein ATE64_11490 [Sphingopyxis sp. H073]KTE59688.1 hypothetical protein ATE66_10435 [Sphingopyxis sp. H107]KTE62233.1 hypothetical protein ATE65_16875 [Sphingopyxis sp. H100]